MTGPEPYDLQRFVTAQDPVFAAVLDELDAGRKQSHWMWFVFPQLRGLGRSSTARFYGLASLDEARAFRAHPTLGPRLLEATNAVLAHRDRSAYDVFGSPDDLKFRSSMTLFARADPEGAAPFRAALAQFYGGREDEATLALLNEQA